MGVPILEITDGTTTINLLDPGITIGIENWMPQAPPIITTSQSSPLTSGSDVASYKFSNANETFDFIATGTDQDEVIETVQDFRRLLIQGLNYQVVDWHNSIVYIKAKAKCETNIRYAVVKSFSLPEDAFPFGQPFTATPSIMNDMTVIIERGDWLDGIPGVANDDNCQLLSQLQSWSYMTKWALNNNFGAYSVRGGKAGDIIQATNDYIFFSNDLGVGLGGIDRSTDDAASWVLNDVNSNGPIFETIAGTILCAKVIGANVFRRSTNYGGSWADVAIPGVAGQDPIAFCQDSATGIIYALVQYLPLFFPYGNVYISNDDGATFVNFDDVGYWPRDIAITTNRTVLVAGASSPFSVGAIYRKSSSDTEFSIVQNFEKYSSTLCILSDDSIIVGCNDGTIYRSTNDGLTWKYYSSVPYWGAAGYLLTINRIVEHSTTKYLYLCTVDYVYVSKDFGLTWEVEFDINATIGSSNSVALSFLELSNGNMLTTLFTETAPGNLDGNLYIYELDTNSTITLGAADTCDDNIHIANKTNIANLTHIKIDDGGAFTDIFPMTAYPTALLPAVPAVNDAIYFGIESSVDNSGPFCSLVFDLIQLVATAAYTIIWEYYNGANWITLAVTDGTGTIYKFSTSGVCSISWEQPSDWTTVAIDGITAWWVRARVSANAGTITPPYQQNRQIYTINSPYSVIDSDNIGGDIPAIAEYKLFNKSDSGGLPTSKATGTHTGANNAAILTDATATFDDDGVLVGWYVYNTTDGSMAQITAVATTTLTGTLTGGTDNDWDTDDAYIVSSGPDLYSQRVVTGLRSQSRGDSFNAFINLSDVQEPFGITITAGTNAAFGADATTPTGRRLTYSAGAGDTTFVDRVTIGMSNSIVRDYYGKFHVFLRGKQTSGSSGDITVRLQVRTGSGGITYTTPEQIFLGTNDWELLDFDAVTIPAGGRTIIPSEIGDEGEIAVQVKNDSGGSRTVYLYDVILIPTDEWAGDFQDVANINGSIIGKTDNITHFIDIDSVRNPKVLGRSLVRIDDSDESIVANYEFSTNGEVILQANADQRIWVLSAYIGSNDEWISEPWVAWSVQAWKNQRYLTQRGSR